MAAHVDQWTDMVGSEPPYVSLAAGYNIRLVELLPGKANDPVIIRLWIHGLGHAPPYEAISYVWGDKENTVPIECNRKKLRITRNLRAALRRLRYQDDHRLLWADAICICQEDTKERKPEKAHHVSFMDKVYRRAEKVLVPMPAKANVRTHEVGMLVEEHGTRLNGRRLEDMSMIADDDAIIQDDRWSALRDLFDSEWFKRTWVLQETGVARNPVVLYGDVEFSYREWEDWSANWKDAQDYDYSAIDLLSHAKGLGCSVPQDRIYAFLGHPLLRTKDDKPMLMPNYDEDYTELKLYTDFSRGLLASDIGIKALSAVEHDEKSIQDNSTPSWTIRWTMDIIWNSMGYYEHFSYRASGKSETPGQVKIDASTLLVQGILVDTVDSVYQFSEQEKEWSIANAAEALASNQNLSTLMLHIARSALAAQGRESVYNSDTCWDAMSMSLCTGLAGYESAEDDMQQHQANFTAFWHLLLSVGKEHGFDLTALEEKAPPPRSGGSADRFYDSVLLACKGRSFFVTKQGYFGLGPWIMKPEDQCFVLKGARVPFVLRASHEDALRLVGECYIHGIMDGSLVDGREVPWQDVTTI